jgi:glycosyltransferase involved in cell wall biosynthesis
MAPEKGLDLIVDAFITLSKQVTDGDARSGCRLSIPIRLKMAGWMGSQHVSFWDEQKRKLDQAGLHGQWEYCGSIDRAAKVEFFRGIDLLCVPTAYQEPKGLFVLESVAAGVPYVQPAHGAFPELHDRLNSVENTIENTEGFDTTAIDPNRYGRLFKPRSHLDLVHALSLSIDSVHSGHGTKKNLLGVQEEIGIDRMATRLLSVINNSVINNSVIDD